MIWGRCGNGEGEKIKTGTGPGELEGPRVWGRVRSGVGFFFFGAPFMIGNFFAASGGADLFFRGRHIRLRNSFPSE